MNIRLVMLVAIAYCTSASDLYATGSTIDVGSRTTNELMVRFDNATGMWPDPLTLIERVKQRDPGLLTALASPIDAYPLVQLRITPKLLAIMPADDPRVVLHDIVVLTYATDLLADVAETALAKTPSVLRVERSAAFDFASMPNDPLYSNTYNASDPTRYQWGGERLNLSSAWDLAKGYGYVGLLDNGIQIHGLRGEGIHEDLRSNYRMQFSYNFGYSQNGVYDDSAHGNPLHGGGATVPSNLDEEPYNLMSGSTISIPNIAGHGTHTAGIIAATTNNLTGMAGVCQNCSLALGRVTAWDAARQTNYPSSAYANSGVNWMTSLGAQVINMSFQGDPTQFGCSGTGSYTCASLDAATIHDVVVVAAAGNDRRGAPGKDPPAVDFPASYGNVIAVAGAQYDLAGAAFWDGSGSFGSNRSSRSDVAGPAKDVLSSTYTGTDWNSNIGCGDSFPSGYYIGYGDCVGTSMAAPHITGLVAIYRSVKPTGSISEVREALKGNATPCVGSLGVNCGAGLPDAAKVVRAALGAPAAVNRLTPLFSFYSLDRYDHFYTVAPQMGTAAILGTLLPLSYTQNQFGYSSIGPLIPNYFELPGVPYSGCGFSPPCEPLYPRALVSIFTTHKNPSAGGPELVPLYRLSYACPSGVPAYCSNHEHVSHVYSTDPTEQWVSQRGYQVDGIEGYVYPKAITQPSGTVKLCRKYYFNHDDYVLFPGNGIAGTDCSANTDGYTPGGNNYVDSVVNTDWIGWVYPVKAPSPVCAGAVSCSSITPLIQTLLLH